MPKTVDRLERREAITLVGHVLAELNGEELRVRERLGPVPVESLARTLGLGPAFEGHATVVREPRPDGQCGASDTPLSCGS